MALYPEAVAVRGLGELKVITGDDPAAGQEVSVTVPADEEWEVLSIILSLTTDATAGNRNVRVVFDDGSTVYAQAAISTNHPASTTHIYGLAAGVGVNVSAGDRSMWSLACEPQIVKSGHRIRTSTSSFQAGDNFAAPVIYAFVRKLS